MKRTRIASRRPRTLGGCAAARACRRRWAAGRLGEGGAARAERRCRAGVLAELMEEEVDEVVGAEGQARPGAHRRAARARVGRGDARRPPRAGQRPRVRSADGSAEMRLQTLRVVRRPRSA